MSSRLAWEDSRRSTRVLYPLSASQSRPVVEGTLPPASLRSTAANRAMPGVAPGPGAGAGAGDEGGDDAGSPADVEVPDVPVSVSSGSRGERLRAWSLAVAEV